MADITIDSITNSSDTGIFDVLMKEVNTQIETQYLNNRITGSDYANVYLGSIQAVLQQSIQYILQEQVNEAQIEGILADNLLKAKQLEIAQEELQFKITEANRMRDTTEAELEKQWGYEVTRDVDGALVLGASTGAGKVDKDIEAITQQILTETQNTRLADSKADESEFTVTSLLPKQAILLDEEKETADKNQLILDKQVVKVQEEIDLLQTQDLTAIYQKDNILPAELADILKTTDVKERGMVEQELTGTKQRIILDTEEQLKQYQVDNILPTELKILEQKIVGKKQSTVIGE